MTQRLSKILLAFEAVILVAPVTALFSMVAMEMLETTLLFNAAWQFKLLALTIIVTSLAAGWLLMFEFWRHGADGLRASSPVVWAFAFCGAFSTLGATVFLATGSSMRWLPAAKDLLWAFVWGLPLLVPLCHLVAERFLRSTANTSLERTRAQ